MAWMCRHFRVDLAESFVYINSLDLRSATARACLHNSVSHSSISTNASAVSLEKGHHTFSYSDLLVGQPCLASRLTQFPPLTSLLMAF